MSGDETSTGAVSAPAEKAVAEINPPAAGDGVAVAAPFVVDGAVVHSPLDAHPPAGSPLAGNGVLAWTPTPRGVIAASLTYHRRRPWWRRLTTGRPLARRPPTDGDRR